MMGLAISKKDIVVKIFEIRNIIDFIDDGYHNDVIFYLTKISNELFDKLDPLEQRILQQWITDESK